jgi:hypothetical protein
VVPFTKNYRKWQVNFTFFLFLSQQKLGVTVFQIASLPTSEIENDKTLAKTEKERKSRIQVLQIVAENCNSCFYFSAPGFHGAAVNTSHSSFPYIQKFTENFT